MTWLQLALGLAATDAKLIARDRFLAFILAYALVISAAVRFGAPPLAELLLAKYQLDIVPYYPLLSSFIVFTVGSGMVGVVLGFILLEAREARLIDALAVTPLTFDRFLTYRTATPVAVAVLLNPICVVVAGVGLPGPLATIVIAAAGALVAGLMTLSLATFADNKVQAFAVMKIINGVFSLPMVAYFISPPWQYVFGLFPPFWLFKAWWVAADGGLWWPHAVVGIVTNLALVVWLQRRFARAVHHES